ncbi:MAG: YbbR-like domain-containing protein [Bacteroidia bacterium]|nr:YbbR-like domain-containing protein [Bacteroidia bacterium]MCC6768093.1 YbbR-like domain-containing protein [Bacteroidia bacterium]
MAGKSRSMLRWLSRLKRVLPVFLLCVIISALFWVLLAFNSHYTTRITVPVEYINMPTDSLLLDKLPESIDIEIAGEGYQLLTYIINPHKATMLLNGHYMGVSARKNRADAFLSIMPSVDHFNKVHNDVKAIRAEPDTIFFNFFRHGFKKVPLRVNTSIEFTPGYGLAGAIRLNPESLHVSGPAEILNKIIYLETETLHLSNVNNNQTQVLKVIQPFRELNYSPVETQIELPVEKYTEAVFDIPLHTENLKNKDSVDINPFIIRVSCTVALSKYALLQPDSFLLSVDVKTLKAKKLKVKLQKQPGFVNNIKLSPDYVDCIVRKR